MDQSSWRRGACAVILFLAATAVASRAQTFSNVVIFTGPVSAAPNPNSPLVEGTDGTSMGQLETVGLMAAVLYSK